MKIRPFVADDLPQIVAILTKIGWAEHYIAGQKKAINKLVNDEEGEVFVVITDAVVGFIQVQHHRWNRLSQLHGLAVSLDHRRQGIAKKLVEHVEAAARNRGNRGVYLDTPVDNTEGRAFYSALGYLEAYTMPEYYRPGLDGVTYLKLFNKISKHKSDT